MHLLSLFILCSNSKLLSLCFSPLPTSLLFSRKLFLCLLLQVWPHTSPSWAQSSLSIPSISRKLLLSLWIFHQVNLFNDLLCLSDPCWGPNSWGGPPAAHRHKFPLSSHVTVAPCQQKNRLQGTSGRTRGDVELWSRCLTHQSDWEIWFHYKNQGSLLVERLISFQP